MIMSCSQAGTHVYEKFDGDDDVELKHNEHISLHIDKFHRVNLYINIISSLVKSCNKFLNLLFKRNLNI